MISRTQVVGMVLSIWVGACGSPSRNATSSAPPIAPRVRVPPADAPQFVALETLEPYVPYLERRRAWEHRPPGQGPLRKDPLPPTPPQAELVDYRSGDFRLPGWLVVPPDVPDPQPAVVYLHHDFALSTRAYEFATAFVEAGFVVFLPTLRAENGNPGDFELLLGEVDDAKAAVSWLAGQPEVDRRFVYVIGHSIGGGIAALLSLHPDVPVRRTATVGGAYRARTFSSWASYPSTQALVRFDPMDQAEVCVRIVGPNVRDMVRPLIAYAGREDRYDPRYAAHLEQQARVHNAPVTSRLVAGDHMSSMKEASKDFIQVITDDLETASTDSPTP